MKNQPTKSKPDALPRIIKATFTAGFLPALVLLFSIQASQAGSATWNLNPTSGDWFTASNWTPATVPNGPDDTATFGVSNITFVSTGYSLAEVNGIVFDPGASAYTITVGTLLTFSGVGITNNSGTTQAFSGGYDNGYLSFTNSATAGSLTAFDNKGGGCAPGGHDWAQGILAPPGGTATFSGSSSAGSATFYNEGTECASNSGAATSFGDSSTAADGTFINYGSNESCTYSPFCGGSTGFSDTSTAGNSTLIADAGEEGGSIWFAGDSTGGTARVEVFGDNSGNTYLYGNLDISGHNAPGVTVGSIEGSGTVYLGANNLTVGSNDLSTTFSGVIQNGGSFTKIGTGTLTLADANTYTGGTTIKGGKLVVNNMSGSGTGTGAVQVNTGTLGGRGIIAGAVTVGTGGGAGAVLAPGRRGGKPGNPLTIQSTLTFNADATYNCGLNTQGAIADQVAVNGLTINGALFSFVVGGHRVLSPGTVFTVISNTAATPITGTFSNLADGSTFTVHGNTFQANYEGGDGNDLTLTVL